MGSLLVEVLRVGAAILSADPDQLFRPVSLDGLDAGTGCPEETWLLSGEPGLDLRQVDLWATWARTAFSEETWLLSGELDLLLELVTMDRCRVDVSCKVDALSFRGGEEEALLAVAVLKVRLRGRGFFDEGKLWTGFVLCSLSLVLVGGKLEIDFFLEFAS